MRELLETIYRPLGITIRTFVVDYQDSYKRFFHQECALPDYGDSNCIKGIIAMLAGYGLTTICIHELLHGYSSGQLSAMPFEDIRKHLRVLYRDLDRVQQTKSR